MNAAGWLLTPLSLLYGGLIRIRNRHYDRVPAAVHPAAVPVISVGNITVGGTGKTPMVIEIVRRLKSRGRHPAIVTRGYRGGPTQDADEVLELRDACPQIPVVVNPDRVAATESARAAHGADCVVLDDGFQHRRLGRDLDIVLIDALQPWGGGWLLPAGRLREPLDGLRRADVVVITRCNQTAAPRVEQIVTRLRQYVRAEVILRATVAPGALLTLARGPVEPGVLRGRRVLAVCGIGNPQTFALLVDTLDVAARETLVFGDHQRYGARELERIRGAAHRARAEIVVTTRKDWVKLSSLWPGNAPELARLDVAIDLPGGDDQLDAHLRAALEDRP